MDPFWTLVAGVAASAVALARFSLSLQKCLVDRWIELTESRDARHAATMDRMVESLVDLRMAVAESNTLLRRQNEWRAGQFGEEPWQSRC